MSTEMKNKSVLIQYLLSVPLALLRVDALYFGDNDGNGDYHLISLRSMVRLLTRNILANDPDSKFSKENTFKKFITTNPGTKTYFDVNDARLKFIYKKKFIDTMDNMREYCRDAETIFRNVNKIFAPFLDDPKIADLIEDYLVNPFCQEEKLVDLVEKEDYHYVKNLEKSIVFDCTAGEIVLFAEYSTEHLDGYDIDSVDDLFIVPDDHQLFERYGHLRGQKLYKQIKNVVSESVLNVWYKNAETMAKQQTITNKYQDFSDFLSAMQKVKPSP